MPYVSSMTPDYSDNKIPGELASGKIVGGEAMLMLPRNVRVRGADLNMAENEDGTPYTFTDSGPGTDQSIVGGTLAKYRKKEEKVSQKPLKPRQKKQDSKAENQKRQNEKSAQNQTKQNQGKQSQGKKNQAKKASPKNDGPRV